MNLKLHVGLFCCSLLREGLGEGGSGKNIDLTASISTSTSVVKYCGLHLVSVLVLCAHSNNLRTPGLI